MLKDVVEARAVGGYRLYLRFEDGVEGEVDLSKLVQLKGVFAPLRDTEVVKKVQGNPEIGTVYWPSGADLEPDVLYSLVTGQPIELGGIALAS